jgi:predicted aspartyl protease
MSAARRQAWYNQQDGDNKTYNFFGRLNSNSRSRSDVDDGESSEKQKTAVDVNTRIREFRVPARLNGSRVSAFPDMGAPANFIALRYVQSLGLPINTTTRQSVKTAVGSMMKIMGTVTLPFSFESEEKRHQLEFNVVGKAVHDIVIGSPFLNLTKTFSHHVHRLTQRFRNVRLPRICFLGSHQYVRGRVNGNYIDAVPDTGAEVSVMSMPFAREKGFVVDTRPGNQIELEFADGSTTTSAGVVRDVEWMFDGSEVPHLVDFYVLEELQTDLILDNTFLYNTNAFVAHEEDFWTLDDDSVEESWMFSIIKLVDRVLNGSWWKNKGSWWKKSSKFLSWTCCISMHSRVHADFPLSRFSSKHNRQRPRSVQACKGQTDACLYPCLGKRPEFDGGSEKGLAPASS